MKILCNIAICVNCIVTIKYTSLPKVTVFAKTIHLNFVPPTQGRTHLRNIKFI